MRSHVFVACSRRMEPSCISHNRYVKEQRRRQTVRIAYRTNLLNSNLFAWKLGLDFPSSLQGCVVRIRIERRFCVPFLQGLLFTCSEESAANISFDLATKVQYSSSCVIRTT